MSYLIQLEKNKDLFVSDFILNKLIHQIRFKHGTVYAADNFSKYAANYWLPYIKEKHPEAKIVTRERALKDFPNSTTKIPYIKQTSDN